MYDPAAEAEQRSQTERAAVGIRRRLVAGITFGLFPPESVQTKTHTPT
jgi:hypothetical protein